MAKYEIICSLLLCQFSWNVNINIPHSSLLGTALFITSCNWPQISLIFLRGGFIKLDSILDKRVRQWGDAALADLCSRDCGAWRDGASRLGEERSASSVSEVQGGESENEKHWNSHFLFSLLLVCAGPLIFASVLAVQFTKAKRSLRKTLTP